MHVVGVDVGGTSVKAALVDGHARLLDELRAPTPREDHTGERTVAVAAELVERLSLQSAPGDGARVASVGLVVPGLVDEERGCSVFAGNLGWRGVPLRDPLARACGLPVAFGHDVRAGATAEARLGAARGRAHALVVAIGTGIAAGVVVDGRAHAGTGAAGELGHLVVDPQGERCVCGRRGCLETVASAAALARRYTARSGAAAAGALDVVARLDAADPDARAVWDDAVTALARALDAAVTVLAPEIVVLAGGLALAGDRLVDEVRSALAEGLTVQRLPEIRVSELGDRAGSLGAALLALDLLGPAGDPVESA